jgi:hypothetical protein
VTEADRIAKAIDIAKSNGTNDGAHHKMWVIDQMVRALAGCPTVTRSATVSASHTNIRCWTTTTNISSLCASTTKGKTAPTPIAGTWGYRRERPG